MSVGGAAARGKRTTILVAGLAIALVAVAAGLLILSRDQSPPTASATPMPPLASLDVTPAAALLPSVGATKQLAATGTDGGPAPGAITWTSSRPEVATVDGAGLVTAKALGSAQVVATVGQLESAPVLITVVQPAPGTVLVEDAQVISDPVETNPEAPVTADSTYDVVLRGVTAKPGDLLLGTGEIPVGGRVVATTPSGSDTKVTLARATLPELLPDLRMEEVIDLSKAPIEIPPDIAANYEIARSGTTLTFTPKPAFNEQIKAASGGPRSLTGLLPDGLLADASGSLFGIAQGTTQLPPFTECEGGGTVGGEGPIFLPFRLSEGPTFEIDVNPALDVLFTETERHVAVDAAPRAAVKVGLKVAAGFNQTYECKADLARFRVPAGWMALLITGLIPVGVGFEIGGELQLAEFGVTYSTEVTGTARIGIECPPPGSSCSGVHELNADPPVEPKVKVDIPEIDDFRVKPSFELFGYIGFEIGNPFLSRLRLEAAEAKVGVKLEADWAPRVVQILDSGYSSEYGLSVELEVKVGADLDGVAAQLGVDDILSTGLERSIEIIGSPAGELTTDKAGYAAGDTGTATITLEEENLAIGSVYIVDHVLLIRYSAGREEILASVPASNGQTEFEVAFTATGPIDEGDLLAFVVTRLPNLDLLALELGSRERGERILFWRRGTDGRVHLYAVAPDGTNEREIQLPVDGGPVQYAPVRASPDGSRITVSTQDAGGALRTFTANRDGTGARELILADGMVPTQIDWSPDGSSIIFSNGPGPIGSGIWTSTPQGGEYRQLISTQAGMPTWSPDGTKFAYIAHTEHGTPGIWVASLGGSGKQVIGGELEADNWPRWSPDGSRILFVRTTSPDGEQSIHRIWSMNPDGSGARALTSGTYDINPSWSPDGTRIAFMRVIESTASIMIMNADGSGLTRLPIENGVFPSWVP